MIILVVGTGLYKLIPFTCWGVLVFFASLCSLLILGKKNEIQKAYA